MKNEQVRDGKMSQLKELVWYFSKCGLRLIDGTSGRDGEREKVDERETQHQIVPSSSFPGRF